MLRIPTIRERIRAIKCALGEERPSLVLKDVNLVNVLTCEIEDHVDIVIKDRLIAYVGDYSKMYNKSPKIIDCKGLLLAPGLVDAHVHIESSMVTPSIFSKYAIMHGVTTVFIDPHEIGNVLGVDGIREFMKECVKCPLKMYLTVPSCIPATKLKLETNPNKLIPEDIEKLLRDDWSIALGEVMDVLSILDGDHDILREIITAQKMRFRVCGHAPSLRGDKLCAYIAAGPDSDHEITSIDEAIEKARRGLYIMIRYGTFSRDLPKIITNIPKNVLRRTMIVSDDINIIELKERYLDEALRLAVKAGIDIPEAVSLCTLNPATYYGIDWLIGCVAPGRLADLILLDKDLKIVKVFCEGEIVYSEGSLFIDFPRHIYPPYFRNTVRIPPLDPADLKPPCPKDNCRCVVNVIEFIEGTILTRKKIMNIDVENCEWVLPEDVYYIAVIERHGRSGNIGKGFCTGVNINDYSIGMTISHDSHNLTVVGRNVRDMYKVVKELEIMGGGIVMVRNSEVIAKVKLDIGGLMSDDEDVINDLERLLSNIDSDIRRGLYKIAPLMFASLVVVPEIRITDLGLVDVESGKIIDPVISYE